MINAVSQFLQMCRNIRIKFLLWVYMYTTQRENERRKQDSGICDFFSRHLFRCFAKMVVGTAKSVVVLPWLLGINAVCWVIRQKRKKKLMCAAVCFSWYSCAETRKALRR